MKRNKAGVGTIKVRIVIQDRHLKEIKEAVEKGHGEAELNGAIHVLKDEKTIKHLENTLVFVRTW